MTDTLINPATRDYTLLDGSLERDSSGGLMNACYLRLATPRGSYWRDPAFGSRLHELMREKDLPRVQLLAQQYAEQALKPILDDGRARSITVTSERPGNGRLYLPIDVVAASGQRIVFRYPVTVI